MPLYFTDKKKHWPPAKPVQYLLAGGALLLAIAILVGWLLLRFVYTDEPGTNTPNTTTTTSKPTIELPDNSYCLFIIEDTGYERFAIIELAPAENRITVDPIPSTLQLSENESLAQMYQRTKAAQVVRAVADHYQLPLEHYVSLSMAELERLVRTWGGSLRMAPPEEMMYQDEKGKDRVLYAESVAMTPQQLEAMLLNTNWKSEDSYMGLAADVATALFNQMLTPNRNLQQCFSDLSAHTSWKIHHFTNYQKALNHLANQNDGHIAEKGVVVPTK